MVRDLTLVGDATDVSINGLDNSTAIGNNAIVNAVNKVRIGNGFVTVIEGQVDWSFPSDGRFKNNVRENVAGLDFIMKLRPVTYNFDLAKYNQHIRPSNFTSKMSPEMLAKENEAIEKSKQVIHTGFIAQEIEAAAKSIGLDFDGVVAPQNEKDNCSVRYGTFVAPLVKAV